MQASGPDNDNANAATQRKAKSNLFDATVAGEVLLASGRSI